MGEEKLIVRGERDAHVFDGLANLGCLLGFYPVYLPFVMH